MLKDNTFNVITEIMKFEHLYLIMEIHFELYIVICNNLGLD